MKIEPLHRMIKRGDVRGIEVALDVGVDPNLSNKYGYSLLMLTAVNGNTRIGKLLIERGANLDAWTCYTRTDHQTSALLMAIMSGKPSFVGLLLEGGASLDVSSPPGDLEIYINWVEKYCAVTAAQVANIRSVIEAARLERSKSPPGIVKPNIVRGDG